MSNSSGMAAATATLRNLLLRVNDQVNGTGVTAKPLDKARNGQTGNQLNVSLYHAIPNPAWRNQPLSRDGTRSRDGFAPLALNLLYFVTAYGKDDDDLESQHLLGEAMRIFHDHPVLNRNDIQGALENNDLHEQIERVRITPTILSAEEISKWWTTFQTPYRLTTTYQVSVVLIESDRNKPTALPVLKRGREDRGVRVISGQSPTLKGFSPLSQKPHLELGEEVVIQSQGLGGSVEFHWHHPKRVTPLILISQVDETTNMMKMKVPDITEDGQNMVNWVPGLFSVGAVLKLPGGLSVATNELPLGLAPIVTVKPLTAQEGAVSLTITATPRIRKEQRVVVIVGQQQILVKESDISNSSDKKKPTSIKLSIPSMKKGTYVIRMRVDGIESHPFKKTPIDTWDFDPKQTLTVT